MSGGEEKLLRIEPISAEQIWEAAELPWPGLPAWPRAAWEAYACPGGGLKQRRMLGSRDARGAWTGWVAGRCVLDAAELEHIVVDPRKRGAGVGRALLQAWLRWCSQQGAAEVWLEVRAANTAALALYRAEGFLECGRRRLYYRDPAEDAVVMRRQVAAVRPHEPVTEAQSG